MLGPEATFRFQLVVRRGVKFARLWLPGQGGVMDDRSIGRADIESSTTEPNSPNPDLEIYYRQQLEQLYADPSQTLAANDGTDLGIIGGATTEQLQGENDEEYDFRLFTRSSASGPASAGASNVLQRIALRSPSPASGEIGFANGSRPDRYYFAGDADGELAKQYAQAAVSGQGIKEGLKMRWVRYSILDRETWT